MVGLYSAWYSNYPQTNFHFFNDNNEWKQVDKVGHAYSAYIESYGKYGNVALGRGKPKKTNLDWRIKRCSLSNNY